MLLLVLCVLSSEGFGFIPLSSGSGSGFGCSGVGVVSCSCLAVTTREAFKCQSRVQLVPQRVTYSSTSRLWQQPPQSQDGFNSNEPKFKESDGELPRIPILGNVDMKTGVITAGIVLSLMLATPLPGMQYNGVVNAVEALPKQFTGDLFDPSQFQPVCGASDSLYFLLKNLANTIVGKLAMSLYDYH